MNITLKSFAFAMFLLQQCYLFGQFEYQSIPNDPLGIREYTLDNGLKIYLSVNKDEPRVQTAIAVRAGAKNDPSTHTGLAHYLEHMLFKGTSKIATTNWEREKELLTEISELYEKHAEEEAPEIKAKIYSEIDKKSTEAAQYAIPNELDKMTSIIGGKNTNAFTSVEQTVYINDIPSNEIGKWLQLESERFQELVLRLFHTELEAVYEEYNRGKDQDSWKVYESIDKALYKNHPYGTQTVIGTSEHLKNPSMEAIHEYFNTYYVPNNIAICMVGDLNPDGVVKMIDQYFGSWKPKDVPKFKFTPEKERNAPEKIKVAGPEAESVSVAYRLGGIKTEDAAILELLDIMLNNGKAGLIDLNLVNQQKVLSAGSYPDVMKDYSTFVLYGKPREGQSLEEVETLLIDQLKNIGAGKYDPELIDAAKRNLELQYIRENEGNQGRTFNLVDLFIYDLPMDRMVKKDYFINKITKQDIENLVNTKMLNRHVTVYKKQGKDETKVKVDKPAITPIEIRRNVHSTFYETFTKKGSKRIDPVYLDYGKQIQKSTLNQEIPLHYIKNTTNKLFSLYYIWDMGAKSDRELALSMQYLQYLGTDDYSITELRSKLFKLGLSLDFASSPDRSYIVLSGLESSLKEGVELLEHFIRNVRPDTEAYKNFVDGILKKRADRKLNKGIILSGAMKNYAMYGPKSHFTTIIQEEKLKSLAPEKLTQKVKALPTYKHEIFFYGKQGLADITNLLSKHHITPAPLKPVTPSIEYPQLETNQNIVYFTNYNMVQTELLFISKSKNYSKEDLAYAAIFNEYFGGGLSSIVFQEIRESKALAYSANCSYSTPAKRDKAHYVSGYIGTQADKLSDAVNAMKKLMNEMPEVSDQFEAAKTSALKRIETDRITKTSIFWNYLRAQKLGNNYDIRKDIYPAIEKMTLADLKSFFNKNIANKNFTYLVIGNKDEIDMEALKQLGTVKELSLKEVFGY